MGDVRGRGYLYAIEFVDPDTGDSIFDSYIKDGSRPVNKVIKNARDKGILFGAGRPPFQVLMTPPFCANMEEIDRAITILDETITQVF